MKKIAILAAFLAGSVFVTSGFSQEGPHKPLPGAGQDRSARGKSMKASGQEHALSGRVAQVDGATGAFSLTVKGITIGFDASHPVFSGYGSLSDMRVGDRVAVSYTRDGIEVTRLSGGPRPADKVKAETERPLAGPPAEMPIRAAQKRLIKREKQRDKTGFDEADIKKDGKITPVGLSVVIKDITMDEFRHYDKKHRGYLNKAEFLDAVKHLKTGGR